ncbi:MAG TPA: hypothetical protein VF584_26605 [Longimicrobium sp.]|jgi:hypothetical protein
MQSPTFRSIAMLFLLASCSGSPDTDSKATMRTPAAGQPPPPLSIELMGARPSWTNAQYVGHAFMCISVPTNVGPREDCLGFYPSPTADKAYIGGPGVTSSEFQQAPGRFSLVTVSLRRTITADQRTAIYRMMDDWNRRQYRLLDSSCIDFVASVAQTIGMATPPRIATELPEAYLRRLKTANTGT